jgi:Tol biopolymer transport system component
MWLSYNWGMRKRLWIAVLLGILLAFLILLGYWLGTPRLLSVSPADEATNVSPAAQVKLSFSRPLQTEAITNRLGFEPAMPGNYIWQGSTLIFTPAQLWPAGVTVQASMQPGAPANGFLALALPEGLEWSFTIRQPSIVYLYPATDPASLTMQSLISGATRSLVSITGGVLDFDISADGSLIYYSVRQEAGSQIYRLSLADGLQAEAMPGNGATDPAERKAELVLDCPEALCAALALSPKGDYLAYERGMLPGSGQADNFQVWVMPIGSGGQASPFLAGVADHQTTQPAWSSAGWLAFYDSNEEAYIFTEPGVGERGRFANQTGQGGVWHPDGHQFLAPEIIFVDTGNAPSAAGLEQRADSHLTLYNLDTKTTQDLTPGEGNEDTTPVFSPDGKFLAFARKYVDAKRWTPGRQLWIARVDTREARPLTNEPLYNHYQISWSLSGEQLAYVRFNQTSPTEPPEIWIMNLLDGTLSRLAVGGYSPRWTP